MTGRNPTPALLALALGYFTFGTSSLAIIGLGTSMSHDLHVNAALIGLQVSVFALTFAVAAPLAPVVLGRLDRRQTLLVGLAVLAVGGVASALAPSYAMLTGARVIAGLGAATFAPQASAAGSLIVDEDKRPRALATVFGGMTAAAVLGVPLATFLGDLVGWRWALAGIALLTVLALALVAALLPPVEAGVPPTASAYGQVARTPGAAVIVLTTMFFMAAQFTVYGVAGAYITARFGATASEVALVLLAFGVLGVIGNASGVRVIARLGGSATISLTLAGLGLAFAGLIVTPATIAAAIGLFAFWAFFSQLYQAPQQARLVALLPEQRAIVLALNASTMYVGVSVGGLLGGTFLPEVGARWLPAIGLIPLAAAVMTQAVSVRSVARPSAETVPAVSTRSVR
ncbi:MFS transporter [Krasilnikovia sp. MM14-A1259]|uniref:MFS transporter n=1 Tax=Krasilnikovia sp. MM14-A1259 TaxID=3373539 RepID=UPI00381B6C8F